jgi:hypothetical protein
MTSTVRESADRKEAVQVCSGQYVNLQTENRLFRFVVDSTCINREKRGCSGMTSTVRDTT